MSGNLASKKATWRLGLRFCGSSAIYESFSGLLICTQNTQMQGENEFLASNPHIDELDKIEDAINTAHHPPVTWQWTWLEWLFKGVESMRCDMHRKPISHNFSKAHRKVTWRSSLRGGDSDLFEWAHWSREASCELWDGIGSTCLYQRSRAEGFVYSDWVLG